MAEAIRDFSTTDPVPFITIDGKPYSLRTHTSIVDALNVRDLAEEYTALSEKRGTKRTPGDDARIIEIMDLMIDASLDAPAAVVAKLDDPQRGAIMEIVSKEIIKRRDPTKAETEQSPDSIGSTASATG